MSGRNRVPKVVCLVGLPGSGKTYVAHHEYASRGFLVVDDPGSKNGPSPLVIRDAIESGQDVVVCDPNLVRQSARDAAETLVHAWGGALEFVYFENAPEKAEANIRSRDDGRAVYLPLYVKWYTPPKGMDLREIWSPPVKSLFWPKGMNLRDKLIRLAREKPEIRRHVVPLLRGASSVPGLGYPVWVRESEKVLRNHPYHVSGQLEYGWLEVEWMVAGEEGADWNGDEEQEPVEPESPKELSSFRILVKHWWPDASPREFQKLERSLVKPFNSDDRDYYGNWWEWKGLKVDLKKFFAELKKLGKT